MNISRKIIVGLLLLVLQGCGAPRNSVPAHAEDVNPLMIGMTAPAFTVTGADGKDWQFKPSELPHPVVLSFYRGGWCPYCNRQLSGLRHAEQELKALGYDVVFLSADRWQVLNESLKEKDLGYRLYSDNDLEVARLFGLAYKVDQGTVSRYLSKDIDLESASGRKHHWLPIPATYIIDADGLIRFSYANPNYKVRLHPELLLTAARLALVPEEGL